MGEEAGPAEFGQLAAVDELLPLSLSRPREALARAREVLAAGPGPREASIAHQAAGIVLREFGDVEAGVRELRLALRLARRSGAAEREADAQAALGVGLVYAGRTAAGLAALDRAVRLSGGVLKARVLHRRGGMLWTLGRNAAALEDLRHAVAVLDRAGDKLWAARALNARGVVYGAMGAHARADADFVAAARLFAETGQVWEWIYTVGNRGWVAFCTGDLPTALSLLDEATARSRPLNVSIPWLSMDRCSVLLAAGLADEALAGADAAIEAIERSGGPQTEKAELLLTAANCALAAGQPQAALDRAQAASRLFQSQRNALWAARARLVLVRARYETGQVSAALLRGANQAVARLT